MTGAALDVEDAQVHRMNEGKARSSFFYKSSGTSSSPARKTVTSTAANSTKSHTKLSETTRLGSRKIVSLQVLSFLSSKENRE